MNTIPRLDFVLMINDPQSFTEYFENGVDLIDAKAPLLSGFEFGNESAPNSREQSKFDLA
ncbi:MAG: hypothetical protein ACI87A_001166 [Planctomycetota bacterium]|jgi:hypothetical protein